MKFFQKKAGGTLFDHNKDEEVLEVLQSCYHAS